MKDEIMKTNRQFLIIWIIFLSCLAVFSSSLAIAQENLPAIVKKISPSVVLILTYDKEGKAISQGSGFFINDKGDVITNHHVLERASRANVKTPDGKVFPVKMVLAEDIEGDLIYISVEIPVKLVRPLSISSSLPEAGERVVVIGNPLGLEQTVSDGIVSAVREVPAFGKIIQITAPISPGSSGSPVVNMKGEVIGVATSQMVKGQNLNFAVPGERVARLVPRKRESLAKWKERRQKDWSGSAEELYSKGLPFVWAEEYIEALPFFKEAVKKNPSYAEAHFQIGYCNIFLGRYQEAIEAFDQTIRIKPDDTDAYTNRGESYRRKGQYARAISDFSKAIEIDPQHALAYNNRGAAYKNKGQYDQAISDFNKAIEIDPRFANAYIDRGNAYRNKGQYAQAISDYSKAIEIDPRFADAYNNRGVAYTNKGQYDQAISDFSKAIEINQQFALAYSNRGFIYFVKFGNTKKGCSDWKQACEFGDCGNYNLAKRKGYCE